MDEVYEFLKKCDTYYLATMDGDQPRVRPFGTIDLFEGKLYIQTGKSKDVSKQMMSNPKIEICSTATNGFASLPQLSRTTELRHASICWTPIQAFRLYMLQMMETLRYSTSTM